MFADAFVQSQENLHHLRPFRSGCSEQSYSTHSGPTKHAFARSCQFQSSSKLIGPHSCLVVSRLYNYTVHAT